MNINLHCLVCVSNMYPSVPPFVALKVELNSNRQVHNIQLKEMEQEVNINFHHLVQDDSDGQGLLLRQLLKVQVRTKEMCLCDLRECACVTLGNVLV